MRPLLPVLLLVAGCESGLATVVSVEVADRVALARSAESPGVLVTDAAPSAEVTPLAALCGEALPEAVVLGSDLGFGCLDGAREGATEVLRAWVQPAPETWDLAAFCALEPHAYDGLTLGADVTGAPTPGEDTPDTADTGGAGLGVPGLVTEPDPSWPQGEVTATWKRDFSPCGGVLRGDVRVE